MIKHLKISTVVAAMVFAGGCATITDTMQNLSNVGSVALDRAQTVSSALSLRDGYIDMRSQVTANADKYTPQEKATLKVSQIEVEAFYHRIINLSQSGTTEQMLVNAGDFLTSVLRVRSTIDGAIAIIQPKSLSFTTVDDAATVEFIRNYRRLSLSLDELLAKNDRAEAVRMAAMFLKSAVPVIASLL